MMTTMIKEIGITFKELERNIFKAVCEAGQNCTCELLEEYDKRLMQERDKKVYRLRGLFQ